MQLDITWCTGLRCGKTNTCHRWIKRVDAFLKDHPDHSHRTSRLSITEFADHDGNCKMYWPLEEEKNDQIKQDPG